MRSSSILPAEPQHATVAVTKPPGALARRAYGGAHDGQESRRRHGNAGAKATRVTNGRPWAKLAVVSLGDVTSYCGVKPSTRNCVDLVVPSRITSTSFELADAFHAMAFSMLSKAITTYRLGAVPSSGVIFSV
jgi:hypothetical protein